MEKWKKAIPRADAELTKNSRVCELHFHEDEIERFYVTKLVDGSISKIERKLPKLKSEAVPSQFPNLPSYLSKKQIKRKSPADRSHQIMQQKRIRSESCSQNADGSVSANDDDDVGSNIADVTFSDLVNCLHLILVPSTLWTVSATSEFIICAKWDSSYNPEKRVVVERDMNIKVSNRHIS